MLCSFNRLVVDVTRISGTENSITSSSIPPDNCNQTQVTVASGGETSSPSSPVAICTSSDKDDTPRIQLRCCHIDDEVFNFKIVSKLLIKLLEKKGLEILYIFFMIEIMMLLHINIIINI